MVSSKHNYVVFILWAVSEDFQSNLSLFEVWSLKLKQLSWYLNTSLLIEWSNHVPMIYQNFAMEKINGASS